MNELTPDFLAWLKDRPESIQALARKYPPGPYVVIEGAPYGISCPGTTVYVYQYFESGEIGVIIRAEDKLPQAAEHEKALCVKFNKDYETVHKQNVLVNVDPKWLEPKIVPNEKEESKETDKTV